MVLCIVFMTLVHFMLKSLLYSLSAGIPVTVTVDGAESHTLLPNLTPGETYRVSVISVKGLEESEPASDTFTTGTLNTIQLQYKSSR